MGTVVNGNATGMSKKGGAMLLRWKGETHVAANASVMTAAIILLCGTAAAAAAAAATACGTLPVVPLLPSGSKPQGTAGTHHPTATAWVLWHAGLETEQDGWISCLLFAMPEHPWCSYVVLVSLYCAVQSS